ncbi:MAG TPA: hypothetical protein VHW02_13055 [Rhizomicrobium sp.]|nr:hypothetical protein [Rhizomicrobium sp.]
MRIWLRRLAWIWLAVGAAVFLYGAITGDGLAGALLYSQLIARHEASPRIVSELLFLPLCLAPMALLLSTYRPPPPVPGRASATPPKNPGRGLLLGGLFGGAISMALSRSANPRLRAVSLALGAVALAAFAFAAWSYLQSGVTPRYAASVNLDTEQPLPPVSAMRISGTARPQFRLSYLESSEVRGTSYGKFHNYVPLTSANWRVGDPVHVLVDIADEPDVPRHQSSFKTDGYITPAPGGYVLRALRDKGLTLADDLVVVAKDRDSTGMAIALTLGVLSLALCFAFAFASQATKPFGQAR